MEPVELTLVKTLAERFTSVTPSRTDIVMRVKVEEINPEAPGFLVWVSARGEDPDGGDSIFATEVRYFVGFPTDRKVDGVTTESLIAFTWPHAREALATNLARLGLSPLPLPPRPTSEMLKALAKPASPEGGLAEGKLA